MMEEVELESFLPKSASGTGRSSTNDDRRKKYFGPGISGILLCCLLIVLGSRSHKDAPLIDTQFITEYDLIRTYSTFSATASSSPIKFERGMRATGVSVEEYRACNSSVYQDPDRKICSEFGSLVCYKPVPNESPVEVKCPDNYNSVPTQWPRECYKSKDGRQEAICYTTASCNQTVSQWAAKTVTVNSTASLGHWSSRNVGWNGGLDPKYPYKKVDVYKGFGRDTFNLTKPYDLAAIECLQKAALKSLSRNGWELADPSQAFTAENWTMVKKTLK